MDKTEHNECPEGGFAVRVNVKRMHGEADTHRLLSGFVERAKTKYELSTLVNLSGDASEAEVVIAVPFADRERIRIDYNVYASEMEDEHGDGLYFHMESAF